GVVGPMHSSRQELQGGRCGVLELKAPAVPEDSASLGRGGRTGLEGETTSTSLADGKLFAIMSELVAEGWLNATKGWGKENDQPLRFSSKTSVLPNKPHRKPRRPLTDAPVLKDTADGTVSR